LKLKAEGQTEAKIAGITEYNPGYISCSKHFDKDITDFFRSLLAQMVGIHEVCCVKQFSCLVEIHVMDILRHGVQRLQHSSFHFRQRDIKIPGFMANFGIFSICSAQSKEWINTSYHTVQEQINGSVNDVRCL